MIKKKILNEGKKATPTWLTSGDIAGADRSQKKVDELGAFSQHCGFHHMSRHFQHDLSAPVMSTDVSQVGVAFFP